MFNVTEGWDWLHDMRLNYASLKMIDKTASYFRVQWSSLKCYLTMQAAKSMARSIYSLKGNLLAACFISCVEHPISQVLSAPHGTTVLRTCYEVPCYKHNRSCYNHGAATPCQIPEVRRSTCSCVHVVQDALCYRHQSSDWLSLAP